MNRTRMRKFLFLCVALVMLAVISLTMSSCQPTDDDTPSDPTGCAHEKTKTETVSEASCEAKGKVKTVCEACGATVSESETEALGHKYVADAEGTVAATCIASGKNSFKCEKCSKTYAEPTAQLSHEYELSAELSVAATCTSEGKTVQKCKNCPATLEEKQSALGHNFLNIAGEKATACEDRKCSGCSEERTKAPHVFVEKSNTATCTLPGKKTMECTVCKVTEVSDASALGHSIVSDWSYTGREELKEGEICVYLCERSAECENCGYLSEYEEKTVHNYQFGVISEATCTVAGTKGYICTECDGLQDAALTVSYTVDHAWNGGASESNYVKYSCNNCSATRKEFTENEAVVNKNELSSEIKLNDTVISMDEESRDAIGDGDATLSADGLGKYDIPSNTPGLDQVGDGDTVYNLTLTKSDGSAVTDFGNGKVTVKIPYTLGYEEDPASITIFYLHPTDGVVIIKNAVYHDGYVTFETNHFSYYFVGRYTARELCELYGHTWLVSEKAPTCTENGFVLTYCVRCYDLADNYAPIVPALGHDESEAVDEKDASCTEDGFKKYNCSRCEYEYTVIVRSEGHSFEVTDEKSADCESAGYIKQTCMECGAVSEETYEQLEHEMKTTVVEPTCVASGYTKYECKNCGASHNAEPTPAVGHKWNMAVPDCGAGQVCTVCNASGLPATGEHQMVNGKCSVCGYGCNHDYQLSATKDASCEDGGYKTYICSICQAEETRDFTLPLGHKYEGLTGACSACEKANPAATESIKTFISSLASESYTIKLTDTVIEVKTHYVSADKTDVDSNIKIEASELYIKLEGDTFKFYLKAEAINGLYSNLEKMGMEIYGDGKDIYIKASDGDEYYYNRSYDAMFESADVSMNGMPVTSVEDIFSQTVITKWQNYIDQSEEGYYKAMADMFAKSFVSKGNNVYVADFSELKKLNENLYTLKISELIDEYCGEGTFADIKEALIEAKHTAVEELVAKLIEYAEKNGIDEDMLFDTVDQFLSAANGENVSIRDMIEDPDVASLTVSQIVKAIAERNYPEGQTPPVFVYEDYINDMLEPFTEVIAYELIVIEKSFTKLVYDLVNTFCDTVEISLTLNADGEIQNFVIDVKKFEGVIGGSTSDSTGEVVRENILDIDGTLTITWGGNIPAAAENVKTEFGTMYDKVEASLKAVCQKNGGTFTYQSDDYHYENSYYQFSVGADGKVYVAFYQYGNLVATKALADAHIELEEDCVSTYGIKIEIDTGDSTYYARFYINTSSDTIIDSSCHNYVEYTPTDIPDDMPTSEAEAECGGVWYKFYKCTVCSGTNRQSNHRSHKYTERSTLLPGSVHCDDGVLVEDYCRECGVILSIYDSSEGCHNMNSTYYDLDTPHGKLTVNFRRCACGENSSFEYRMYGDNVDGCQIGGDTFKYEDIISDGDIVGCKEYYRCSISTTSPGHTGTVSECPFYMVLERYYGVPVAENSCKNRYVYIYKFFNEDTGAQIGQTFTAIRYDRNHAYEYTSDTEKYPDGSIKERYDIADCKYCDYFRKDIYKYDELGREIYAEHEIRQYNGDYDHYYNRYEYISESSCVCNIYYFNFLDMDSEQYQSENHKWLYYEEIIPGTCSQPSVFFDGCSICKADSYYREGWVEGHRWNWDNALECYVCLECGLESVSGASDIIIEDLTSNDYYGLPGTYVIGFNASDDLDIPTFTFVNKTTGEGINALALSWDYVTIGEYFGFEYYGNASILIIDAESVANAALAAGISLDNYDFSITLYREGASPDDENLFSTIVLDYSL